MSASPDWITEALEAYPANLTKREAAQVGRVSIRTVDRWIASGRLSAVKIGERVLIPKQAMRDLFTAAETA